MIDLRCLLIGLHASLLLFLRRLRSLEVFGSRAAVVALPLLLSALGVGGGAIHPLALLSSFRQSSLLQTSH